MGQRAAPEGVTGMLCWAFAILCALSAFRGGGPAMALFAALAYVCLALSRRAKSGVLRLALALPPGLALLLAPGTPVLLALAAAWGCVLLTQAAPRALPDYRVSRLLFLALAVVLAEVLVIFFTDKSLGSGASLGGTLGFSAAFVVFSAAGLQLQRTQAEPDGRTAALNLALTAAPLGAAVAGAGMVALLLRVLRHGIEWLLMPFGALFFLFIWLRTLMVHISEDRAQLVKLPENLLETPEEAAVQQAEAAEKALPQVEVPEFHVPWAAVGLALLAVILVCLLIWYLRRERAEEEKGTAYEQGRFLRGTAERRGKRGRKSTDSDNARTIRNIYREYLLCVNGAGVNLRKSSTSLDVFRGAGGRRADQTLRSLYLPARYGGAEITDEQVRAAREALEEIKRARQSPHGSH